MPGALATSCICKFLSAPWSTASTTPQTPNPSPASSLLGPPQSPHGENENPQLRLCPYLLLKISAYSFQAPSPHEWLLYRSEGDKIGRIMEPEGRHGSRPDPSTCVALHTIQRSTLALPPLMIGTVYRIQPIAFRWLFSDVCIRYIINRIGTAG